jgi:Tol biopolymer transport system component
MEPAWSPDGTQITFISFGSEEPIFIVNASGGTATNVSTPTINDRNPVWSSGAVPPTASINDVSVTEGNRGSVEATFIVTLSSPSDQPLTVGYATANNRAVAPDDYTQTTGTLSFAPGELRKTFSVPVLGDDKFESIETFFVNLRAVSNVGLGDAQGVATILDDDVLTVEEGMIVFQLSEAEVADIWLMRADGSEQFNITNTPDVIEVEPTWSPDGTRILYTRYLDSETFSQAEIYVMNADGSNRINLTRTLNVNETSAGWSPDGSQIVYVSSTFDGSSEIAVMNADGSNQRRITRNNGSNPSLNLDPVWSPRGNKIAFSGNREGRQSIIVMDTNGANEQILTNNEPTDTAFFDRQPKWSPNGSKITFMREDEAQSFQWDVMLVDANGDNLVNLTGNSNNNDMYPSFSPDGTQIVFSSNADEGFDLDLYALAVPEDEPDTEANASRGKAALPAKAGRAKIRVAAAIQLTNRAGAEEQPDWLRRRLVNGIGVTVRDVRVTEGSSGLTNAVLTVRLSRAARQTVTVKYATANLTARAPLDYQSATGTISFAPGETSKNVTVQIKGDTTPEQDERLTLNLSNATGAGFLDNVAAIEILDDDFAPRNVAVSPANVTGFVGSPQRFTASYSDENGATDIAQAYILINTRLSRTQALSALYDRARNKLYLRNDADTAWLGGFAPGSNNQIANSQGTLNCALTTVRVAGRSLAVTWSFTPNERFSGTKNVFISVNDKSGLSDSWDALGKWTIMNFFDWISSFFQSLASPVQLSSANTTRRSVTLNFTGALDATTANDISRYVVEVNGQVVPVQRASRQSPDTVILQLRDGLGGKEQVRVYWKSLRDANGRTLSGQTPAALVP